MKKLVRSFFSFSVQILIFAGLIYQIFKVSQGYFSFNVSTALSFDLNVGNVDKTINVRFFYYEVLDTKSYTKDKNVVMPVDTNGDEMFLSMFNFSNDITVDDIMKYTPSPTDMIKWCDHRSSVECDPKSISVEKLVNNVFVMYRFKFNGGKSNIYDESVAYYTPNNYAVISYIMLKPELFRHCF